MLPPAAPNIYHIVHVDRLASIVTDGCLWSDVEQQQRMRPGTTIGMNEIKQRRLTIPIRCRPGLRVGECVPFYFCPRSIMLYVIHKANHARLQYRGGQGPIVHLEAELHEAVNWAELKGHQWAFTLSNAGSSYFEDRCELAQLDEINWVAIQANNWRNCQEDKQAEFLVERSFPWTLIRRVGVHNQVTYDKVMQAMRSIDQPPAVSVERGWYY